uniref:Uncharacterized protein n=1 Tax=Octopus bimaculoides TaxID=37653 RepID=A0A0L8I1U9_OCTBM
MKVRGTKNVRDNGRERERERERETDRQTDRQRKRESSQLANYRNRLKDSSTLASKCADPKLPDLHGFVNPVKSEDSKITSIFETESYIRRQRFQLIRSVE